VRGSPESGGEHLRDVVLGQVVNVGAAGVEAVSHRRVDVEADHRHARTDRFKREGKPDVAEPQHHEICHALASFAESVTATSAPALAGPDTSRSGAALTL